MLPGIFLPLLIVPNTAQLDDGHNMCKCIIFSRLGVWRNEHKLKLRYSFHWLHIFFLKNPRYTVSFAKTVSSLKSPVSLLPGISSAERKQTNPGTFWASETSMDLQEGVWGVRKENWSERPVTWESAKLCHTSTLCISHFFPKDYIVEKISEIPSTVFWYLISLALCSSPSNTIHPFAGRTDTII